MLDEFTIYGGGEWAIQFCPFCGTKLPQSRREEWFSKLEGLGVDPWRGQIPEEFRSDAWWRK